MDVSAHKCQVSIKSEESQLLPLKVGNGTPLQTERKDSSNRAAQWKVFGPCLASCTAIKPVFLLKLRKFCMVLLKSVAQRSPFYK